jgi:hypothetical protein
MPQPSIGSASHRGASDTLASAMTFGIEGRELWWLKTQTL